ncbi:MAG: hypothetical protein ACRDGU_00870 [Actinomycetota bacterium]
MEDKGAYDPRALDRTHGMAWNVARLAEVIRDPGWSQSFCSDPYRMVEEAGIDPRFLPSGAVEALSGMGPEELRVISEYSDKLIEAGFYLEATKGEGGKQADPRVSFF